MSAGTRAVRPVEPHEHESVGALTVEVYRLAGWSYPEYEPYLRDVASRTETATVLVARGEQRVVGAVTVATRLGPWAEQAVRGEAIVRMLVVAPDQRGAGVGDALSRAAVDVARADGCTMVRLSSRPDMTAAHRLYERLGFTRTRASTGHPTTAFRCSVTRCHWWRGADSAVRRSAPRGTRVAAPRPSSSRHGTARTAGGAWSCR